MQWIVLVCFLKCKCHLVLQYQYIDDQIQGLRPLTTVSQIRTVL